MISGGELGYLELGVIIDSEHEDKRNARDEMWRVKRTLLENYILALWSCSSISNFVSRLVCSSGSSCRTLAFPLAFCTCAIFLCTSGCPIESDYIVRMYARNERTSFLFLFNGLSQRRYSFTQRLIPSPDVRSSLLFALDVVCSFLRRRQECRFAVYAERSPI